MNNGIPVIGQQQAQQRAALAQELAGMTRDIYVRTVSSDMDREAMHTIAKHSHEAAKAFFEGLGIVEFQPAAE